VHHSHVCQGISRRSFATSVSGIVAAPRTPKEAERQKPRAGGGCRFHRSANWPATTGHWNEPPWHSARSARPKDADVTFAVHANVQLHEPTLAKVDYVSLRSPLTTTQPSRFYSVGLCRDAQVYHCLYNLFGLGPIVKTYGFPALSPSVTGHMWFWVVVAALTCLTRIYFCRRDHSAMAIEKSDS